MSFVIAEPCLDVQDQACVSVCPVACMHGDAGKAGQRSIDPHACMDGGACEPACPVEAISADFDLPYTGATYAAIEALWYRDQAAARAIVATVNARA